MTVHAQTIIAPDGTEMVVITRADFDRLIARDYAAEDERDEAAADRALQRTGEVMIPHPVMLQMLGGATPVAAWRTYRGLSQHRLAQLSGITQTAVSRLERRDDNGKAPFGRLDTRRKLARALDVPVAALEPLED